MYSLSPLELQTLRDFIDKHLSIGLIHPTSSPHGAPVLFIKKKDGSLRLTVDYRALNRITRKDRYPLPLTADLLDAPRKARVYTRIDLRCNIFSTIHVCAYLLRPSGLIGTIT
jgi:hypothetical protein